MASNTQQFGTRGTIAPRMVNEVGTIDNPRLENQLTELTSLVRQLAIGQHQPIATWSTLLTCAPHCNNLQFQQNMSAIVQDLKTQVGQLANSVSQLQSIESGNLPSQIIPNPRGNASKVEINIPLLDAIKQIPKYTKFLKKLCVHKRKKMKGGVELGGIVSILTRNDDLIAGTRQALPKKCRDPRIFSIPCTIGDCTFADAMLDLGASINVVSISIYKSLNC
ncbi:hypothetical protein CR513_20221, partial [Mucuna pruriens]